MLPNDHPSSFCKLTGLTSDELNLVLEASGFLVKRGKNTHSYHFQRDSFNSFLQCPQLQLIDKNKSQPKVLKRKEYWAYLIGKTSGDARLQSFPSQLSTNVLPPPVDESNVHRIALKDFALKLIHLVNKEDTNDDNGSNTTPSAGDGAQELSRDGSPNETPGNQ